MSTTPEDLSQAALRLAPAERLALVEHILDSLDVPDPAVDDLWAREAQDRLSAYRRGAIQAIPLGIHSAQACADAASTGFRTA